MSWSMEDGPVSRRSSRARSVSIMMGANCCRVAFRSRHRKSMCPNARLNSSKNAASSSCLIS